MRPSTTVRIICLEEDFLKDAEAWRGQHSAYLSTEFCIPTVGLVIAPGVRYDFIHQRENILTLGMPELGLNKGYLIHLI